MVNIITLIKTAPIHFTTYLLINNIIMICRLRLIFCMGLNKAQEKAKNAKRGSSLPYQQNYKLCWAWTFEEKQNKINNIANFQTLSGTITGLGNAWVWSDSF